ncbi:hypothetical protein ACN6K5_002186 [Streptomyces violaceoruber]|uniref:hypothetical protein n=1 Tax=Streptomyces violaceoruber group TaxID=2867121 RepID=UPI00340D9729
MFLVTTDTKLGAVVVAPECADDLDDETQAVIEAAAFTWRSDIEAFTQPGQNRQEASRIALRLTQLGHDVLAV